MITETEKTAGEMRGDRLSLLATALSLVPMEPVRHANIGLSGLLMRLRFRNLVDMRHGTDVVMIDADTFEQVVKDHPGPHQFGRYDEAFEEAFLYYGFRRHDGTVFIFKTVRFDSETSQFEIGCREVFLDDRTPGSRENMMSISHLEPVLWPDIASLVVADWVSGFSALLWPQPA